MGESHENLLKAVRHCQESLDKYTENRNDGKLLHYLERLYKLPIKVVHLEQTGVGRTVNGLRKLGGEVGDSAKGLVAKWKEMVVGEQEEEDDDDEDEEDEDEEDGYQTGDEQSNDSDDKDGRDDKIKDTSSSHRKSDSNRTDDKDKAKKNMKSDSHSSDSSKSSKKEKDRHHKHNGHSRLKTHKRKIESSNSEDETPRKKNRKSEDEDRHKPKRIDSDSEEESKSKERRHKFDKFKLERAKKSRESSMETDVHKASKVKEKYKDKEKSRSSRKEEPKKQDHSTKTKEKEKKSKEKVRNKSEEKKKSTKKSANGSVAISGIDSGSGASFAEALGMCEPSSSKSAKKKALEKKEKPPIKVEELVPKLLKEPTIEPIIDINISSLLPTITPNYRPLGNLLSSESQHKNKLSESEALTNSITSKNQRTKVYSGNKTGNGKVSSLFELCIRILQDNIDALEYTGGVPYTVLKPILEKATPNQLYMMEHHNPYLVEDTDELWQLHCQKEFRNKNRQEMETWREMYLRCLDERDAKLKALTANIKQAQDKSLPVRMTKLAYVDAVAKPPRNIARKQAKNGTAFDVRKPSVTPTQRLNLLATAGDAGKVAVPNPGSRAAERSSSHAQKPKKAPLMLKSISSFKNRFKR